MKIIELVIDEDAENVAVDAVSLVREPAIETDWYALNKQKKYALKLNEDKRIITGPALIPQKQIFRSDQANGDYYIWFSKSTVAKCNELFFKNYNQKNVTFEHEYDVDGNFIFESWIKEDNENDKSNLYNFDAPVGTWFISMKIENDEVWNAVKDGSVRGYSIEGHFADALELSKTETTDQKLLNTIKQIISENAK
jgi:hypothetical protein